ncbi:MAG: hypothetical protein LOY01_11010, partial [Brachybacterium paraconglomeratum]|nr:hypothetical protein [Brachybacterium paraconglomeratum]
MLGSHGSSSAPRARPLNRQRRLLERYLTTISGAEAYGIIGMKLLTLGLGGLIVWGIGQAHQEGTTEFVLAVLLLGPCVLPVVWIALYTYSGFVIGRLAPSGRTAIGFVADGAAAGVIPLADPPRETARTATDALH